MKTLVNPTRIFASLLAIVCALILVNTANAQVVGKVTAEKATIEKSGAGRLRAGAPISLGDRLKANASGEGLIVFDDESSARLGPNANLVIDDFVYNADRKSGTIRLRQTAGTARIFGGQISKRGSSEIRTPHIVLGVRGGIADVIVRDDQSITTLRAGLMVCRVAGKKRTVTNPGISCVSDGTTLTVIRLDGEGLRFVDPVVPGGSTGGGGSREHCNSAAGQESAACSTRDTKLPGSTDRSEPRNPNDLYIGTQPIPPQVVCDPTDPTSQCYQPPVPCDPTDPTSQCYQPPVPCDPTDPTSQCYQPPVPCDPTDPTSQCYQPPVTGPVCPIGNDCAFDPTLGCFFDYTAGICL